MLKMLAEIISRIFYLALHVTSPGSFPAPLSAKKEKELIKLSATGDTAARNKLVEHNLRLVAHIVKKYYASGCEQDDLISIGTIGLIKAISTFNDEKGIRLATYAARCIENEILMYFRNLKKTAQDVYISDPIETDREGNTLTLIDVIADDGDIAEEIDKKMKIRKLRSMISGVLDERELKIIKLRYGLSGEEELTQREVAKLMGISRSYVSRIEKAALEKLRAKF